MRYQGGIEFNNVYHTAGVIFADLASYEAQHLDPDSY